VHEPNPLVEANLAPTRDGVRALKADFGVCFDGDADRCMVIDERGEPVGCDLLTAWLAQGWLRANPGASIVYDLRSTRSVAEAVREAGGVPVEGRVGHVFMKQKLRETGAPFGGELSGHFYYRDMWCTDSGARAFANVVSALVESGRPMSECIGPFRRYSQSGEINFENDDKQGALDALRARYPHARFHALDGLSMDCGDWWANIRMSNTEPLLRLNLEARDAATVAAKVRELEPVLGHRVDH
jgi:phosphomannomutase